MKRWAITSFIVLLFPVFSFAWNEPEGFKDFRWGMSESQVSEILQNKYFTTFYPGDLISVVDNIGDVRIRISFGYIPSEPPDPQKSKLGKILLTFENKDFSSLSAAFLERYGRPTSTRTATFTNAFGANLKGDVLEWKGQVTTIVLSQYGGTLDHGFSALITKEMQGWETAEKRQKAKDAAKGF